MIYQEYLPFVSLLKQVDKKEIKLPFPLEYTIEKIEKIKKKIKILYLYINIFEGSLFQFTTDKQQYKIITKGKIC